MSRGIKIGIIVAGIVVVLSIVAIVGLFGLFVGTSQFKPSQIFRREIPLANHDTLIIDGNARGRSEHGFSQRAGYRPPGSTEIEWFGDVSDGVQPEVYKSGPLVVVIDLPSASLFVRTSKSQEKWKSLALVFPNDLGPFPISFYAERNGLTTEEVSTSWAANGSESTRQPTSKASTQRRVI